MTRRLIAGLIVVGLAIGVWLLWPRSEPGTGTTTTALAVGSTTTTGPTTVPETGATSSTTGTTLAVQNRDVETVEEAEAILKALWFGWFEGIYNQDEDRIKEVVASQLLMDAGRDAMGSLDFIVEPTLEMIVIEDLEILESSNSCTVIWAVTDANAFLGPGPTREAVDVLRWVDGHWAFFSSWTFRDDLWETDCDAQLESVS